MKEYKFKINGKQYNVAVGEADGKLLPVNVNGKDYSVELEGDLSTSLEMTKAASAPAAAPAPAAAVPAAKPAAGGAQEKVVSPLPGVIIEVSVKEGQAVKAGQKVAVLEAMKMENEISAPKDGTITAIHVHKGDSILEGAPIVSLG
ncbi:MAG: biotin/lipoyl-binding protein [Bacteroidales bacterium]|nr:biotin/lipoyl-binding protein [Bacteroidales bacterium]